MTWIIGSSSIMGDGLIISDVRATFRDGQTRDTIKKAFIVADCFGAGFAGSVSIGYQLIDSLRSCLRVPRRDGVPWVWEPSWVANKWSPIAKRIFDAAPPAERALGSRLLLVAMSPSQDMGVREFPRAIVIRFSSPDFRPGFLRPGLQMCSIGSGSGVSYYKQELRSMGRVGSSVHQGLMAGPGGWAMLVGNSLRHVMQAHPTASISRHLNILAFNMREVSDGNNDVNHYVRGLGRQEFRMPELAKSYADFSSMAASLGADATCAKC